MKYLKRIFETLDLTNDTKKVLKDFGLKESEYEEIIKFIGKLGLYDVKNNLPFFNKWDNFNVGYDQLRQILDFYHSRKSRFEKSEEIEDHFLDLIEDKDQTVDIKFNHTYQSVDISFDAKELKDLSELSRLILMIDDRFKRANKKYKIVTIFNRTDDSTSKSYTILRLEYS